MAEHSGSDNIHTRGIADFVSSCATSDPGGSARAHQAPDARLARLRALRRRPRMVPHPAGTFGELDPTRTTSVWGTAKKLSAPHAALVNGTQVQGFELDDVHRAGVLHVGAVVLPALIAIAESHAGHERQGIPHRRGRRLRDRPARRQLHGTGAHRAGLALGRDARRVLGGRRRRARPQARRGQTVHALGIAGTQAAGLMAAQYGAMVKRMHAGRSSQSGLYGALLAKAGFTGIVNVFEASTAASARRSRARRTASISTSSPPGSATDWQTMGVALKFYSCVGSNHTTLDAIRDIAGAARSRRRARSGSSCTARRSRWTTSAGSTCPQGLTSAQLNLPYLRRHAAPRRRRASSTSSPRTRCRPRAHGAVAEGRGAATIRRSPRTARSSGTWCASRCICATAPCSSETREAARGSEQKFASDADIVEKFRKLTAQAMPCDQQDALVEAVLDVEKLADSKELIRLLHVGEPLLQRAHERAARQVIVREWRMPDRSGRLAARSDARSRPGEGGKPHDDADPDRRREPDERHRSGRAVRARRRRVAPGRRRLQQSRMLPLRHAAGPLAQQRRLLRRSRGRRRGAQARRHPRGRHRQQRALRRGGHHGVDRAARRDRDPACGRRRQPRGRARARHSRAQRRPLRLPAAQLGLLADQSRSARGRRRHRGDPRPHRLSRADVHGCGPGCRRPTGPAFRPRSSPGRIRPICAPSRRTSRRCARASTSWSRRAIGGWARTCCNT